MLLHLLDEVQPTVVDVILGEGRNWFWSLPQSQVAIVGLADDQIVQLLWRGVMVLNLTKLATSHKKSAFTRSASTTLAGA